MYEVLFLCFFGQYWRNSFKTDEDFSNLDKDDGECG
jgi:hypothetical protein